MPKRTAVPTEDPDNTDTDTADTLKLHKATKSKQNNIVTDDEEERLKGDTDDELPPKLNLTANVNQFVTSNLEKNTKKVRMLKYLPHSIFNEYTLLSSVDHKQNKDFIPLISDHGNCIIGIGYFYIFWYYPE